MIEEKPSRDLRKGLRRGEKKKDRSFPSAKKKIDSVYFERCSKEKEDREKKGGETSSITD